MNALVEALAREVGARALPDDQRYKNKLEIRSESSTRLYVVSWDTATTQWACSCPGWLRFRRCKHIATMRPSLERASKRLALR